MSPADWKSPVVKTGALYAGWGAYGAGLVVGDSCTNLIENPNFRDNINNGWTGNGVGAHTSNAVQAHIRSGEQSFRLTAGASAAQRYTTLVDALPNGQTVHATCWMKVMSGTGTPGRLIIYDTSTPATRATGYSSLTNGTWEMVHVSWTNNTGVAKNIRIYLGNYANDSTTQIYFDEVQMTFGTAAYPTTYIDGDKPGGSWVGTPGNSHSTKTGQDLEYTVSIPNTWTVSFWWTPHALASETTASSSRILEWYGDSNDRLIFYQPASTSTEMRIYHQVNGNLSTDDYTGSFTRGEPQHIIATYNGSGYQWWVNGVNQGYTAHSQTWGTTPYVFAVGSDYSGGSRAQGVISDLFVLDKAVDADFVSAVYNATVPAAINNDLFFKVFDPEAGSTTITPKAFIITGSGNALGVSTNPDPMVIGGMTVDAGDLVIGDNQPGGGAIYWDASALRLGFHAAGESSPAMWWDKDGLVLRPDTVTSNPTSIKWIRDDYPDDPFGAIQLWNDDDENWFRIRNYPQSGVTAWMSILSFGYGETEISHGNQEIYIGNFADEGKIHLYVTDPANGARNGMLRFDASAAEAGSALGLEIDKIRFNDAVKYVREPGGGTDRTGYLYVPLTTMDAGATTWPKTVTSAGGVTLTVSSEWSTIPANVGAIVVRMHVMDTAAGPQTGIYAQIGPQNATNQYDHLSLHPWGSSVFSAAQGIIKVTSNNVYLKYNPATSMSIYLGVVGYFI